MKGRDILQNQKYNLKNQENRGFTLLEVLIAVIILAVACIPIMHAFVTSANTTSKASVKMYATNAAENVMETTRNATLEEFVKYWETVPSPAPGAGESFPVAGQAYSMSITKDKGNKDVKEALDKGFSIQVDVDPTFYQNTNSINLSQFDAVSSDRSAIYCMDEDLDKKVYEEFEAYNETYRLNVDPGATLKNATDFKKELKREIRVDISKKGTFDIKDKDGNFVLDDSGNKITGDQVVVDVVVSYYCDTDNIVDSGVRLYRAVDREIFNNVSSEKELRSIFILYNPRYEAAKDNGDIIIVHNHDDIEANLYIVAQNVNTESTEWKNYIKKATGGLNLQIYEDERDYDGTDMQPLILRTNLIDESDVEFNRPSYDPASRQKPVKCFLNIGSSASDPEGASQNFEQSYSNVTSNAKKGDFGDADDAEAMRAGAIDGKTLDSATIRDRLYDVRVTVTKTTAADEWPISVELTGTMLE